MATVATRREKLPCGCRARAAFYKKNPARDWGRVNVEPTCEKKSHWSDLVDMTRS